MTVSRPAKIGASVFLALAPVLSMALACASAIRQGYRSEYDEFTRTGSEIVEFFVWSEAPLRVPGGYGSLIRVARGGPAILSLTIDHDGSWRYLTCPQLHMLADGEPVALSDASHDGRTRAGGVVETISTLVSDASTRQLAAARRIRIRVCND